MEEAVSCRGWRHWAVEGKWEEQQKYNDSQCSNTRNPRRSVSLFLQVWEPNFPAWKQFPVAHCLSCLPAPLYHHLHYLSGDKSFSPTQVAGWAIVVLRWQATLGVTSAVSDLQTITKAFETLYDSPLLPLPDFYFPLPAVNWVLLTESWTCQTNSSLIFKLRCCR